MQRALGLHQRRLHRLIDALGRELEGDSDAAFHARDHYVARIFDLIDLGARHLPGDLMARAAVSHARKRGQGSRGRTHGEGKRTETRRVRYEEDLYAWTQEQAAAAARRGDPMASTGESRGGDRSRGRSDRRKLESRLCIVLLHLLKWQSAAGRRGASWRKTLRTQRREIRKLLQAEPEPPRRHVPELIRKPIPTQSRTRSTRPALPRDKFRAVPTRQMMCWTRTICPMNVRSELCRQTCNADRPTVFDRAAALNGATT